MPETREHPQTQSTNTSNKILHYCCIPCKKRLCGSPMIGPSRAGKVTCVVCLDLWRNLHCCPNCGGDRDHMWGR
jgi:hypothetical protein